MVMITQQAQAQMEEMCALIQAQVTLLNLKHTCIDVDHPCAALLVNLSGLAGSRDDRSIYLTVNIGTKYNGYVQTALKCYRLVDFNAPKSNCSVSLRSISRDRIIVIFF